MSCCPVGNGWQLIAWAQVRKDEHVVAESHTQQATTLLPALPMCSQQGGRLGIDRDTPLLARLRLLLLDAGLGLRLGPLHDHFVAKSTCRRRKALISPRRMPLTIMTHKSEPPVVVPPGSADDCRRLLGAGRVRFSVVGRRRDRQYRRAHAEVTPSDSLLQCSADEVMIFRTVLPLSGRHS